MISNDAPWKGRQGHSVTVLQKRIFLCGGFDGNSQLNDIWYTWDCGMTDPPFLIVCLQHSPLVSWYQLHFEPTFSPRQGHSLIAFQDSLFLIGGFGDGKCLNDTHQLKLPVHLPHEGDW
jgi:leucine-zipper-like transcriptional regulator 1